MLRRVSARSDLGFNVLPLTAVETRLSGKGGAGGPVVSPLQTFRWKMRVAGTWGGSGDGGK